MVKGGLFSLFYLSASLMGVNGYTTSGHSPKPPWHHFFTPCIDLLHPFPRLIGLVYVVTNGPACLHGLSRLLLAAPNIQRLWLSRLLKLPLITSWKSNDKTAQCF